MILGCEGGEFGIWVEFYFGILDREQDESNPHWGKAPQNWTMWNPHASLMDMSVSPKIAA